MTPEETTKNKEFCDLLRRPFPLKDIQWKPCSMGERQGGAPWVQVLAYLNARALENFLDATFGVMGWSDEYTVYPQGIICKLSVLHDGTWISKSNGAPETDIEAFKGGCSSALKRVCASGYGITRYLYYLGNTYAPIAQKERPSGTAKELEAKGWTKSYYKKDKYNKGGYDVWWNTPVMPAWAQPKAVV